MQFISSDTNVWIDFFTIEKTELPFRLPFSYIMYEEAIKDEFCSPPELGKELVSYGLIPVDITIEEFSLAEEYGTKYNKLSKYDRIALAIAKKREIVLLTGDSALRKAADQENVNIMGTLGVLDRLREQERISDTELLASLQGLLDHNGGTVRLPKTEIISRIERITRGKQC